jgi:hypothetical protein
MRDQLSLLAPRAPAPDARPGDVPADAVRGADGVWRWAVLSREAPTPLYRYALGRWWAAGPRGLFVMLNPSTADGTADDNTIRRCVGFARAWGWGSLLVANLYAWRATDPADLWAAAKAGVDVAGPELGAHLAACVEPCVGRIVAAWGAGGARDPHHTRWVTARLGPTLTCLRVTPRGAPEHPLYLPKNLTPIPFPWEVARAG